MKRGWIEVDVDLREVWNLLDEAVDAGYDKLPVLATKLCRSAKVKNAPGEGTLRSGALTR